MVRFLSYLNFESGITGVLFGNLGHEVTFFILHPVVEFDFRLFIENYRLLKNCSKDFHEIFRKTFLKNPKNCQKK